MFRKLDPDRVTSAAVSITVDGKSLTAEQGEPLAAVLLREPPYFARATPVTGARRAPFCMMGVCFECLVEIDGTTSMRSCLAHVRPGMNVRRQQDRPDPMPEITG